MKAVVVEIKDNVVAVLSNDGCVVTAKNNNYEIGQVIQMNNPRIHFANKVLAFAASAAALVVLSVGTWAYASPYTYVSLDVNPSIEFTVNRFDRVLSVRAVNDDGDEIIKEISLKNLKSKTIQDALAKTVDQISELGYFDGTIEGGIVIATSGKNTEKAEELAQELQQTIETEVAGNGDIVEVEAISVGLERVEQARELGVTPGKLNLVEKLQAAATDPTTIILDEWLDRPVKEIMKATKDFKKPATVSGSAIIVDEKEINKEDNTVGKDTKAEEKVVEKEVKSQDKADIAAEKAVKKAEKAELKAAEKANLAIKEDTEATKDAAEIARKEAEVAKEEAEVAKEEAEVAKEEAEKVKEEAEIAKVEAEIAKEKTEKAKEAIEEGKKESEITTDNNADEANKTNDNAADKGNPNNNTSGQNGNNGNPNKGSGND